MNPEAPDSKFFPPAQGAGLAAFCLSAVLFPFNASLAAAPLAIFVILCVSASLSPRSCFFLPVISRGRTGRKAVALTFDDGPDPLTTPPLLDMLARHSIKAAFFVCGRKAQRHPEWIGAILSQGHLIGNHSYSHSPFLMLSRFRTLFSEVATAQDVLSKLGVKPLAFRPPVGLTNPKLGPVLLQLGMFCVTFRCRAYDRGNRRISGIAGKILQKVRPDDIVLLHDVRPKRIEDITPWLDEVEKILCGLKQGGFSVLPLDALIGRPVMVSCREETS